MKFSEIGLAKAWFCFLFCAFTATISYSQKWNVLIEESGKKYMSGDLSGAIHDAELALDAANKEFGKKHPNYVLTQNQLGHFYTKIGEYSKAESSLLDALLLAEKVFGIESSDISSVTNNLAGLYSITNNFEKSEMYFLQTLEILRKLQKDKSADYANTLNGLAILYKRLGLYNQAEPLYLEALNIRKSVLGVQSLPYANSLNALGLFYHEKGEFAKAEECFLNAIRIVTENKGEISFDYANYLNSLGGLYFSVGQTAKTETAWKDALDIREYLCKTMQIIHPDYAQSLNNLGGFYKYVGNLPLALEYYSAAVRIRRQLLGPLHSELALTLSNLAGVYADVSEWQLALNAYREAESIFRRTLGNRHYLTGVAINNIGLVYRQMGKTDSAEVYFAGAGEILRKAFGGGHPQQLMVMSNLSQVKEVQGKFYEASVLLDSLSAGLLDNYQKNFRFLSETEKQNLVESQAFHFQFMHSFYMRHITRIPTLAEKAFNLEVNTKGMVLASGISLREVIASTQDKDVLAEYEEWISIKQALSRESSRPSAAPASLLKWEKQAEELEKKLTRLADINLETPGVSSLQWQDVQKALQSGETAIEFAFFQYYNGKEWTDSTLYTALLLRHDNPHPVLVSLCEQRQLDSVLNRRGNTEAGFISALYRGAELEDEGAVSYGKRLYELIWAPLEKHLNTGERIFFAPSGSLHQVSFAAIPTGEGKYLSDVYRLEQMSTTAMLARGKNEPFTPKDLVLFGGISYDEAAEEKVTSNPLSMRSLPGDLERGGSWKYLPGTKAEVEAIHASAKPSKVNVRLYEGKEATEERYKALSGKNSPRILHIATHGFFFPDPQREKPREGFIAEDKQVFRSSDNPLNRAGLLFAGANRVWQGEQMPEGREDGILTAYEATGVILQNTKLVVLSACETGLGDIKGSEGVFGLQRAFKAAGAEYLLMSLWKVPDRETAEFMNAFYERLFEGKSIPEAFQETQALMRNKYPKEPYKWAAFVLVR